MLLFFDILNISIIFAHVKETLTAASKDWLSTLTCGKKIKYERTLQLKAQPQNRGEPTPSNFLD